MPRRRYRDLMRFGAPSSEAARRRATLWVAKEMFWSSGGEARCPTATRGGSMNPWFLLAALGALLAIVGLVAVFVVSGEGENTFKLAGVVEIKSRTTGAFLAAIGAALCFVGIQQGTNTETHVTDAQLTTDFGSDSVEYNVRCPIAVPLIGSISVSGDPGTVSYRLDRQDGLDA